MNTYEAEQTDVQAIQRIERSLVDLTTIVSPRLTPLLPSASDLDDPPPAVASLVHRITKREEEAANEYAFEDAGRREAPRSAYQHLTVVVPVDRQLCQQGEPFKALIQDISESGVRILHTRVIQSPYFIVAWRATELAIASICLLVKVKRSEPRGLFYSIAGEFVFDDLDD